MNTLSVTVALLLGSAILIYFACEYFVNGVEWVGRKFAVGQQATGSILAAFGTALPESVITFIAVVFGANAAQKEIGVGAALGGPLVLSTIAYAVVGLTLLVCRQELPKTTAIRGQFKRLSRDQGWFLVIFSVKIALGLIAFAYKPWLGVLFLAAYAAYFWKEMLGEHGEEGGELEPLKLTPKAPTPATWAAVTQTLIALVVIFAASRFFVGRLDALGPMLGIKPQLLALLLSPIATELPETLNAIIWVRQGKHRLALANISGAMMIQATVPTALGLFFTPWLFDQSLVLAAAVTVVAVGIMFFSFRRGLISRTLLASMALLYVVFAVLLVALHVDTPEGERMRLTVTQHIEDLSAQVTIRRPDDTVETLALLPSTEAHHSVQSTAAPAEPHEFDAELRLTANDCDEVRPFWMEEPPDHHHAGDPENQQHQYRVWSYRRMRLRDWQVSSVASQPFTWAAVASAT